MPASTKAERNCAVAFALVYSQAPPAKVVKATQRCVCYRCIDRILFYTDPVTVPSSCHGFRGAGAEERVNDDGTLARQARMR
jgi:hypothetical protein